MAETTTAPPERRRPWQQAVRTITGIELTIGGLALAAILIMVFTQALQRYLPGRGIAWTGEIAGFSLIWITFAVAGVLITSNGHIALELIDTFKNRMIVRWVQVFALAIVAAVGVGLVIEAIALIDAQGIIKSPVLRMPMSWVYIPVLIGAISTTIRSVVAAILIALHGPVLGDYDVDAPQLPEVAA